MQSFHNWKLNFSGDKRIKQLVVQIYCRGTRRTCPLNGVLVRNALVRDSRVTDFLKLRSTCEGLGLRCWERPLSVNSHKRPTKSCNFLTLQPTNRNPFHEQVRLLISRTQFCNAASETAVSPFLSSTLKPNLEQPMYLSKRGDDPQQLVHVPVFKGTLATLRCALNPTLHTKPFQPSTPYSLATLNPLSPNP